MRITCCFSGTIWAEKTEDRSLPDGKGNMIDSRESAEALRQPFHFDHRLRHRDAIRKTRRWIGLSPSRWLGAHDNALGTTRSTFSLLPASDSLNSSFHPWKVNVRRHSRAQTIVVAGQTNLHAEHLFDPVSDSLHIARRKFGLPIDLLDNAVEIGMRK